MKRVSVLFLVVMVFALPAAADTLMKVKDHTDSSYHHGTQQPAEDSESELWIGDGRMAYFSEDRRFIFDLDAGKLYILEGVDTAYVETDLPLDLTSIVPPEFAQRLAMYPTTGQVKMLEGEKTIHGRKCRSYMIHHWIDFNGGKYNETERTVWVTDGLVADRKYEDIFNDTMFKLNNFSPDLIAMIKEAGGWTLSTSSVRFSEGQQVKSSREVVELVDSEPDADVYSIPSEYRKKDVIDTSR